MYLLPYWHGAMLAQSGATALNWPDLTVEQVAALLQPITPERWTRNHAGEVYRQSGGHPHLAKTLVRAWCNNPHSGWAAATEMLGDDRDYLLHTLAIAAKDAKVVRALRDCQNAATGFAGSRFGRKRRAILLVVLGITARPRSTTGVSLRGRAPACETHRR